LVEKLPDREKMVIKQMDKLKIYKTRSVETVMNEQRIMSELMHPFLINMRYAFQDSRNLYLVTEYIPGGDLGYYLDIKKKVFSQDQAKFIAANIILALEFMHVNGVIH
jgi:serine/threonine protein kinase